MPTCQQSTLDFVTSWEGPYYPTITSVINSNLIGYGTVVVQRVPPNGSSPIWYPAFDGGYPGSPLLITTINQTQAFALLEEEINGLNPYILKYTSAALTQNQYDALVDIMLDAGAFNAFVKRIFAAIQANNADLSTVQAKQQITAAWNGPYTISGVYYSQEEARRNAELALFFNNYNGNNDSYRNAVTQNNPIPTKNVSSDGTGNNTLLDFASIQENMNNVEMSNAVHSWGSRNSLGEETDWIGLKQFLLYLSSRYYPQNLIPFIELIPVYSLDNTYTNTNLSNKSANTTNPPAQEDVQSGNTFFSNSQFIDPARIALTKSKVDAGLTGGGVDLFTIDPWNEVTSQFNVLNDAGKNVLQERGFGYKILGSISLNPAPNDAIASKAGGIGFDSIEIESGNETNNYHTLVIIKLIDVQGNKLLDINSPWSFILNGNTASGGDFYFRYGWQIRIPAFTGTDYDTDDLNAKKFWNHPGWNLFEPNGGTTTKTYLSGIGQLCDNTLTLTQSIADQSLRTPGYSYSTTADSSMVFTIDRDINPISYMALTMLVPEISMNSEDGSLTATMTFMATSAIANMGSPIAQADNLNATLTNTTNTKDKTIISLNDVLVAYLQDNAKFFLTPGSPKIDRSKMVNSNQIDDWVQVIQVDSAAGQTTATPTDPRLAQTYLDPKSILLDVPTDMQVGKYKGVDDQRSTLEILRKLFEYNGLTMGAQGDTDPSKTVAGSGQFILFYNAKDAKGPNAKGFATAARTLSLAVNRNLLNSGYDRIAIWDDVFSFRFQGSLVESIQVEQIQGTANQAILDAELSFAKQELSKTQQVLPGAASTTTSTSLNISLQQRKTMLELLESTIIGLNIKCLCHPWIAIGKPIGLKGNGFFDGFYLVNKVKHSLSNDGKFISEITAFRITNQQSSTINSDPLNFNPLAGLTSPTNNNPVKDLTAVKPPTVLSGTTSPLQTIDALAAKTITNPYPVTFYNVVVKEQQISASTPGERYNTYISQIPNYIVTNNNISDLFISYCAQLTYKKLLNISNPPLPITSSVSSSIITYLQAQSVKRLYLAGKIAPLLKRGDLIIYTSGVNNNSLLYSVVRNNQIDNSTTLIDVFLPLPVSVNNPVKDVINILTTNIDLGKPLSATQPLEYNIWNFYGVAIIQ